MPVAERAFARGTIIAAAILLSATAPAVHTQGLGSSLQAVIELGDPLPGTGSGAFVTLIGDEPAIDSDGNVAIVALVRDATSDPRQAILRRLGDRLELVFQTGDAAPGVPAVFAAFPGLPFTPRIDGGRLFVTATVSRPGASPRAGLWTDRSGTFEPLILQGDPLPGMPAGAGIADWDVATRQRGGVVLLRGRFAEGSSIGADSRGLWRNRTGAWEPLVVRDLPAPGVSGARFSGSPIGPFGPIFAYGADGAGRVATQSWISGRRIDEDNDEGLWVEGDGGLSLLVREGGRVAGKGKTTFGPALVTFGGRGENVPIVMNSQGVIAFGAVLRGSRTVVNSIWTTRSGAPVRLLTGALPISGQGTGDPAPGLSAGARFGSFLGVALNDAGAIAFQGFADEFGDLFRLTEGIWWDAPGSLTLALATGHPAPGLPGATTSSLRFESLHDDGSLIASAFLTGSVVTPSSDRVLYRFPAFGAPTVLLREGSEVEVVDASGTRTRRTVAGFGVGQGSSSDGTLVLDVTFTGGSGGVYLLKP